MPVSSPGIGQSLLGRYVSSNFSSTQGPRFGLILPPDSDGFDQAIINKDAERINQFISEGKSPDGILWRGLCESDPELVQMALDKGASVGPYSLMQAISITGKNNPTKASTRECIQKILDKHLANHSINICTVKDQSKRRISREVDFGGFGPSGQTPLMVAVISKNYKAIEALLTIKGIDLSAKDENGMSAWMLAEKVFIEAKGVKRKIKDDSQHLPEKEILDLLRRHDVPKPTGLESVQWFFKKCYLKFISRTA